MKRLVLFSAMTVSAFALPKREAGEIFVPEETCTLPGLCAPCRVTDSGNLAGIAVGMGLIFGTSWLRRRKD